MFVQNSTMACNVVLRNLRFKPRDCLVFFSTTFAACKNTIRYITETTPATGVEVDIPDATSDDTICDRLENSIQRARDTGLRPRACVIDTIASFPGVRMPFERLVKICKEQGVLSYIDGAHGVGHIPLDLQLLQPDFFASNCHKWLYVPRKCAVLYAAAEHHEAMRSSLPTSAEFDVEGLDKSIAFSDKFKSLSTLEGLNYLCVDAALAFRRRIVWAGLCGEEAIYAYLHHLAERGGAIVSTAIGSIATVTTADTDLVFALGPCAFTNVRLPLSYVEITRGDASIAQALARWMAKLLLDEFDTAVVIDCHSRAWWARLSAQIYLEESDFVRLGQDLKTVCERVVNNPSILEDLAQTD